MFLIIFLIGTYLCQPKPAQCFIQTALYQTYGAINTGYFYFDNRTFTDPFNTENPPTVVPTNINGEAEFMQYITSHINCTGQWCINNNWICTSCNDNCYIIGQIIPPTNQFKEIQSCETAIIGNLVMVYKVWDQQLSSDYYGERVNVYGNENVVIAYTSIYKNCYGILPPYIPIDTCIQMFATTPSSPNNTLSSSYIIPSYVIGVSAGILAICVVSMVMIVIVIIWLISRRKREEKFNLQ
jgi:hypothetical protein